MIHKFLLLTGHQARLAACRAIMGCEEGLTMTLADPKRNADQNALMWVWLEAFSQQLEWPVNGVMTKLDKEEWKDLLTAGVQEEEVRVAPSVSGRGMVMLGQRTSQFSKRKMADFIDFLQMVAAERGVVIEEQEAA